MTDEKPPEYARAEIALRKIACYVDEWRAGDNALHAIGHIELSLPERRSEAAPSAMDRAFGIAPNFPEERASEARPAWRKVAEMFRSALEMEEPGEYKPALEAAQDAFNRAAEADRG